jgi:hypothetical protein
MDDLPYVMTNKGLQISFAVFNIPKSQQLLLQTQPQVDALATGEFLAILSCLESPNLNRLAIIIRGHDIPTRPFPDGPFFRSHHRLGLIPVTDFEAHHYAETQSLLIQPKQDSIYLSNNALYLHKYQRLVLIEPLPAVASGFMLANSAPFTFPWQVLDSGGHSLRLSSVSLMNGRAILLFRHPNGHTFALELKSLSAVDGDLKTFDVRCLPNLEKQHRDWRLKFSEKSDLGNPDIYQDSPSGRVILRVEVRHAEHALLLRVVEVGSHEIEGPTLL